MHVQTDDNVSIFPPTMSVINKSTKFHQNVFKNSGFLEYTGFNKQTLSREINGKITKQEVLYSPKKPTIRTKIICFPSTGIFEMYLGIQKSDNAQNIVTKYHKRT